MENKTEIDNAVETLIESSHGLSNFYEELYGETINDFDALEESSVSVKADLWRKITSLQEMASELQSFKTQ
jgi:hypothetical protein